MSKRLGWLTPDSIPVTTKCRVLFIPDDVRIIAAVSGALYQLTKPYNWEQFGLITPNEIAASMLDMLDAYYASTGNCGGDMNCNDVLECMLPYLEASFYEDADIRIHPVTNAPQVSYDGGTTWSDIPQSGNGSINAPQPTPTSGAGDDAKICLASSRAALVIAEFYKQSFGAFTADLYNALGTANTFLQDVKMVLFNAIYSPYDGILETAGFLTQDFETNYTAGELSSGALEDLLCLLIRYASVDVSGVVTFDYGAVRDNVIADIGINPGTALWFLLGNIQEAGLNTAGSVRITDTPLDCTPCMPTWCYIQTHNFESGVPANVTTYGAVLQPQSILGSDASITTGFTGNGLRLPTNDTPAQGVAFNFDQPIFLENVTWRRRVVNANTPRYQFAWRNEAGVWTWIQSNFSSAAWTQFSEDVNQLVTGVALGSAVSNTEYQILDDVQFRFSGVGTNPFGADNC